MSRGPEGRDVSFRAPPAPRWVQAMRRDRRGVTAMEYALIGAFIFLAIVLALGQLGAKLRAPFATLSGAL